MRLSEVKGDRVLDVIADLIEPVGRIAQDPETRRLLAKRDLPEGMTQQAFLISRVTQHAPTIIRSHKDDVVAILSTISGVTPDEYRKGMTFGSLVQDAFELLTDDAFADFLGSQQTETASAASGDASEATPAPEASGTSSDTQTPCGRSTSTERTSEPTSRRPYGTWPAERP